MFIYSDNPNYRLKEIDSSDLEDLRTWKNANKQYFFHKEDITAEQQENWFFSYVERGTDDLMFVVQEQETNGAFINTGCMGYRKRDAIVDVYNIMRGRRVDSDNGVKMKDAFMLMNAYVNDTCNEDITCVVLSDNPTRTWYEACEFELQESSEEGHVLYKLNKTKAPFTSVNRVEK